MTNSLTESLLDPADAVIDEICPAGEPWMKTIRKGQVFRILDTEGNQAVDTLFYNAHDPAERYSAVDTLRALTARHPGVRFVNINVAEFDAVMLGDVAPPHALAAQRQHPVHVHGLSRRRKDVATGQRGLQLLRSRLIDSLPG